MFYFLKIWFAADFKNDFVRMVYVLLPDIFLFLVWPMATVIPPLIEIYHRDVYKVCNWNDMGTVQTIKQVIL
jgi:hypothetical protein